MWSPVELREIRIFLTLAEELHFGRTAGRLGLTPSRVSQALRTLEARIGGRLFLRTSRHVSITPLGEQLAARMRPAYEQLERAFSDTHNEAAGLSGPLRIGTYTPVNYGPHFLEIVKTFEARHPDCQVITTETGLGDDQFAWLRRGDLDLLAMRLPISEPDVTVGPVLSREPRVLAVAGDHPLAKRMSVSVEDLADYDLQYSTALPREMIDAFVPPRTPSGRPIRRVEAHSLVESITRVATGRMVHATVRPFLEYYAFPGVTSVPIRDLPPSETALIWLSKNTGSKIDAFIHAATDVLASHPAAGGTHTLADTTAIANQQASSQPSPRKARGSPPATKRTPTKRPGAQARRSC